ncbi:MAG: helix-turn-helix transcriptional regulator [Bacilli bacterium]|nr:helix-turn-helix transcriptional regulator [Bacilli bacterium]
MSEKSFKRTQDALNGNDVFIQISKVDKHYPIHFHSFYELEIAIEGSGTQIVNGNKYNVDTSTVFIYHVNDYHEIQAENPLTMYNIGFNVNILDDSIIETIFSYENEIVIALTPHKLQQTVSLLNIMYDISNSLRSNKYIIMEHLLNALLFTIIGSQKTKNSKKKTLLRNDVLQYIHKNFAKSPSLEEISSYSGYQKNYFCEIFKKKTGMTYVEYITHYKINYSKKLLKIQNKSIKEISFECGFDSASNFIREFKKRNKMTPKEYRKLHQ